MRNEIFMRRFQKVIVHKGKEVVPKQYLLGMLIEEFEQMGYRFSMPLLEVLGTLNEDELK